MKRFLLALAVVSGLAVSAMPARADSLSAFINTPTTISDPPLSFTGTKGTLSTVLGGGATFDPTLVAVTADGKPGLKYQTGQFDVSSGQSMDVGFQYKVTTSGAQIEDNSVTLFGTINTSGRITVTEDVFSDAALTHRIASELVFVVSSNDDFNKIFDQKFFDPTSGPIYIVKDIKLSGGTDPLGHAAFSLMTQDYSLVGVPEPSTIAMAIAGVPVLGLVWARRRRKV